MKACKKCGETKVLKDFGKGHCKDGYQGICKACRPKPEPWLKRKSEDFAKRYSRNTNLKFKFGITADEYDVLHQKQNGLCAICQQPERFIHAKTKKPAMLAVDHDHATGNIRGLLCARCNRGIGYLQHDIEIIRRAEEYLT